jgi:hypothetical protein
MLAVHPLCPLNSRQIQVIGKKLTDETSAISASQRGSDVVHRAV